MTIVNLHVIQRFGKETPQYYPTETLTGDITYGYITIRSPESTLFSPSSRVIVDEGWEIESVDPNLAADKSSLNEIVLNPGLFYGPIVIRHTVTDQQVQYDITGTNLYRNLII